MKKKILSIMLSLTMVLACIPAMGAAYADDETIKILGFLAPKAGETYSEYLEDADGIFDAEVTGYDNVKAGFEWYADAGYTEEVTKFEAGKTYYYAIDIVNPNDTFLGKVEDYSVIFDLHKLEYDSVALRGEGKKITITGEYSIAYEKVKISSVTSGKTVATVKLSYSAAGRAKADGYQVQICSDYDFDGKIHKASTSNPKATSLKITGLSSNTCYYARVRAKIGSSYSEWSAKKEFTTGYATVKVKNSSVGKTYSVIKKGKYAYVAGKWDVFLVNTSTNKLKARIPVEWEMYNSKVKGMAVYNGYLYYATTVVPFDDDRYCEIGRINLDTGKLSVLKTLRGKTGIKFKVKKGKIYYRYSGLSTSKYYVMSTSGKNLKKKSGKITFSQKTTNVKGYKYTSTTLKNTPSKGEKTYKEYLKKSSGKKILMRKYVDDGTGA